MTLTTQMKKVVQLLRTGAIDRKKGKDVLVQLAKEQRDIDRLYAEAMIMVHDARVRAGQ